LQTTFVFKGFDECRRLGLSVEREASLRAAASGPGGGGAAADAASRGTGALVVDGVVPGGPASGVLEPGDVLLSVAGQEVVHFLPLEAALDDAVGSAVEVSVERGGARLNFKVDVADLHAVTPKEGFEVAGGLVHALSYQVARNQRTPTGAVFVADSGYLLGRAGESWREKERKKAEEEILVSFLTSRRAERKNSNLFHKTKPQNKN